MYNNPTILSSIIHISRNCRYMDTYSIMYSIREIINVLKNNMDDNDEDFEYGVYLLKEAYDKIKDLNDDLEIMFKQYSKRAVDNASERIVCSVGLILLNAYDVLMSSSNKNN